MQEAEPPGGRVSLERFDLAEAASRRAAEGYGFALCTNGALRGELELSPAGIALELFDVTAEEAHRDAHGWRLSDFLRIYNLMNAQSFSPPEMAMPMWIMIDLGLLPSGFVMMTKERPELERELAGGRLDRQTRRILGELLALARRLEHRGPIPVAAYCAAPSLQRGRFVGWSLCTAERGKRLGEIVKGLALEAYGASVVLGVTQFTSPALRVHSRFGPLRILVASLELHTAERTFVYECDLAAWRGGGLPDEDEPSFLLDPSDSAALARMQDDIAARRAEFHVLPPGLLGGPGAARLPILRVERVASSAETA